MIWATWSGPASQVKALQGEKIRSHGVPQSQGILESCGVFCSPAIEVRLDGKLISKRHGQQGMQVDFFFHQMYKYTAHSGHIQVLAMSSVWQVECFWLQS